MENHNVHSDDTSTMVHLEVQAGTTPDGNPVWRDAGKVELLDEDSSGVSNRTNKDNTKDISSQAKKKTFNHQQHKKEDEKQQKSSSSITNTSTNLISVTKYLAPHAKTKKERQRIMLFRNAPKSTSAAAAVHNNLNMNTNLLILLHGTGDTHRPYDRLGQTMALPQTATLAIQATSQTAFGVQLPFGLGSSWFHEMDYTTGTPLPLNHPARVQSLNVAIEKLCHLIHLLVLEENGNNQHQQGWIPERIFLLGYGSGACLAMETCKRLQSIGHSPLGGSICISGGCSDGLTATPDVAKSTQKKATVSQATPILLMTGSIDQTMFPPHKARESVIAYNNNNIKKNENNVQLHIEPNKGQGMISSPSEMKIVMEFLSKKLVRMTQMHTTS